MCANLSGSYYVYEALGRSSLGMDICTVSCIRFLWIFSKLKNIQTFAAGLVRFSFLREVVQQLIDEYQAATKSDYISWGIKQVLD